MSKKSLSERDICTKYISPAIQSAGWALRVPIREEVTFTAGRIFVKGKLPTVARLLAGYNLDINNPGTIADTLEKLKVEMMEAFGGRDE
jgi:hypothetical protein